MVVGVTNGFAKDLEIVGVGYRVTPKGPTTLELALGYSHSITVEAPSGITFEAPSPTRITVRGNDKQAVGEVAAKIRKLRRPSPTRARACATQAKWSGARPARLRSEDHMSNVKDKHRRPCPAALPGAQEGSRDRGAPLPRRLPFQPAHSCPGHRRCLWAHLGGGLVARSPVRAAGPPATAPRQQQ